MKVSVVVCTLVALLCFNSISSFEIVSSSPIICRTTRKQTATVGTKRHSTSTKSSLKLAATAGSFIPIKASKSKTLDPLAPLSYISATSLQWSLIIAFTHIISKLTKAVKSVSLPALNPILPTLEICAVASFFFFMSVRSRVFSPLDNSRPRPTNDEPVFKDRLRPKWQPQPIVFPIVWSTIAILRTISSVLIWRTTGSLLAIPLLFMYAHLCIGDTWNTINNVEQRLGTAVLGVQFVYASVLATTYQYYLTNPLAAYILAPSCVWLTVANALVYSIWRVNYYHFNAPSLFPSKEEGPLSSWRLPFSSLSK